MNKQAVMYDFVHVCLTLPPATTDFPEAGSLTQPVEPLLFDQLHDLRLNLFPQLPSKKADAHIISSREISE